MAALNFPDPAVTQTYTEAGITWTWNATLGVWSSEPGASSGYLTQVDLTYIPDGDNDAEINNTGGNNATVPIATDTVAGLFTGAEKQKLAGIEDGAAANQDLSYASAPDKGTVEITDGTDAVIPVATAADSDALPQPTLGTAGLFTGLEKEKLAGIEPGAQVNGSGSDFDQTAADALYLSKVNDDTAAGEITFQGQTNHQAGASISGAITEYKVGVNLQYKGSGISDIASWRNGANNGLMTFSTTDGDTDPVERMRIDAEGQVRLLGNSGGRIFIDANGVTSGYDSFIQQTDTGLEFKVPSNSRGFEFSTGTTTTPKFHIDGNGKATFRGASGGRIFFDSNAVTSGYDSLIEQTDVGLEFTVKSNSRGFAFKTGSTPTAKVEINSNGVTTFADKSVHNNGVEVLGGSLTNKLTIAGVTSSTQNFLYLNSSDCFRVGDYDVSGISYRRLTLGSGTAQSEKFGRAVDFIVAEDGDLTGNQNGTLLSFYSGIEDFDDSKEYEQAQTIIQSVAGTNAEYAANGNLRVIKFRISKNGSLAAGNFISGSTVFNYKIDGTTGEATFNSVTPGQLKGNMTVSGKITSSADIITTSNLSGQKLFVTGATPTGAANEVINFRSNLGIYADVNSGNDRVWHNLSNGSSFIIGPRSGGSTVTSIALNATTITKNGTPLSSFTPVEPGVAAVGITDAVTTVKSLLPHASGFDATQLQSVLPGAFSTNEVVIDADENTTENVTSYDQTKLIPLLTKALQEALERIDALEAQLNP